MSRARDFADLAGSANAGGLTGRNLAINGAMQVSQRGDTTGHTSGGVYGPDRFKLNVGSLGTWSISQSTESPANQGFSNSLKLDCTATASVSSGSYMLLQQILEGQDVQQLKYGTVNAESVVVSFWIKSSKTGTYSFELQHQNSSSAFYHTSKTFTVSSANTWEKKEISFAGNADQNIINSNGTGFYATIWLGAGSNFTSGTFADGTWGQTSNTRVSSSNVNLADSTSNELYLTGLQIEVGGATPFEHRSFADELDRCHRYFYKRPADGSGEDDLIVSSDYGNLTNNFYISFFYPKEMRARPTYGNASGWVTQSPLSISEGVRWTAFNFSDGSAYLDRSTTFEFDAEF